MPELVSVEEYLRRTEKPNCDYIDGVLRPKPMAGWRHPAVQSQVAILANTCFPQFASCIELTCRLTERKYFVADVAVMHRDRIQDPYPTEPVDLCAEILSPEDRFSAICRKCEDYLDWGVPTAWMLDPESRRGWEYHKGQRLHEVPADESLTAEGISIPLADVFSVL